MTLSMSDLGFQQDQLKPGDGWHCGHFFYAFDRNALAGLPNIDAGVDAFLDRLDPTVNGRPQRFQVGIVLGHKADFSVMMMDPDPIKIEATHQSLMASPIGVAIRPTYSFVSISEVSEYAQTVDQYAEKLKSEGADPSSSAFETKLNVYAQRLEKMNYQRLTPDFPDWPVSCFYPMNKWREPHANWFMLPKSERHRLMSEHARSGIKFAGKVSQLITVGVGIDDWEWGVTLWGSNPMHLKQIVYDMRFDEA